MTFHAVIETRESEMGFSVSVYHINTYGSDLPDNLDDDSHLVASREDPSVPTPTEVQLEGRSIGDVTSPRKVWYYPPRDTLFVRP